MGQPQLINRNQNNERVNSLINRIAINAFIVLIAVNRGFSNWLNEQEKSQ